MAGQAQSHASEVFSRLARAEQAHAEVRGQVESIVKILERLPEQLDSIQRSIVDGQREIRAETEAKIDQLRPQKGQWLSAIGLCLTVLGVTWAPLSLYISRDIQDNRDQEAQLRELHRTAAVVDVIAEERRYWTSRELNAAAARDAEILSRVERLEDGE